MLNKLTVLSDWCQSVKKLNTKYILISLYLFLLSNYSLLNNLTMLPKPYLNMGVVYILKLNNVTESL